MSDANDSEPQAELSLAQRLANLGRLDQELLRKAKSQMDRNPTVSQCDFFILGALRRTLAQSSGFAQLIKSKNFPCGAALLRMQIDTAMRVVALSLVEDREGACRALLDGVRLNKLKDSQGNRLTDAHLVGKLAELHPWVQLVYEESSGFIHLSARHFYTSIVKTDDETRTVHFEIGPTDPVRPESDYFELVDTFFRATKLTGTVLLGYLTARATVLSATDQPNGSPDAALP